MNNKEGLQRAALMGVVSAILMEQEDMTGRQIKDKLLDLFQFLIESEVLVGDAIEALTIQACKEYCEQMIAVEEANEILGNEE